MKSFVLFYLTFLVLGIFTACPKKNPPPEPQQRIEHVKPTPFDNEEENNFDDEDDPDDE
jgi:hypothetical protein